MRREYHSWVSHHLGRTMEFLWFGERGYPVLLFPTSMGRFWQNEDFGLTGALADKVDAGYIQLVCVDSVDTESWYNRNAPPAYRARRHDDYDRYLRHELIPYVQHRSGRGDLGVCGASFGAYHAANLAGRYPGVVTKAVLFSGLYHVGRFLDGYWDDLCYFHCPEAFVANADDGARPAPPAGGVDRRHRRARLPRRREPPLRRPPPGEGNRRPRRVLAWRLRARLALLARRGPAVPVTARRPERSRPSFGRPGSDTAASCKTVLRNDPMAPAGNPGTVRRVPNRSR